jgi:cell division transport system permease protein
MLPSPAIALTRRLRDVVLTPAGATRAGLELGKDEAPLHLDWIVAAMAFLAALAIVGALATADAAQRWRTGLTGSLTVELPAVTVGTAAESHASTEERLKRALDVLRAEPGIQRAAAVPQSRIAELLAPWLGTAGLADTLPVPQLIDVMLAPDGHLDMAGLKQRLAAAVEGASVDDHQLWVADLVHLARLGVGVALAIVLLVALTAAAAMVIATRAGLAVHHDAIDLLHLMGAEDDYIADQFAGQATRLGLRGGLLGLLIAALALVAFGVASQAVDPKLLPRLWPSAGQLLPLLLVPPAAAGLGWFTARWTVRQALKKKV